ncbi:MAG: hypothetical protein V4671_26955 [Armatimonadota bacterium]
MNNTFPLDRPSTNDNMCPEAARLQARVAELEKTCRACDLAFWFLLNSRFENRFEAKRALEALQPAQRLLRPFDPMISYSLTHGMSPLQDPAIDALVGIATMEPVDGETGAIRAHRMQQIALDALARHTGLELAGALGEKAQAQHEWLDELDRLDQLEMETLYGND